MSTSSDSDAPLVKPADAKPAGKAKATKVAAARRQRQQKSPRIKKGSITKFFKSRQAGGTAEESGDALWGDVLEGACEGAFEGAYMYPVAES